MGFPLIPKSDLFASRDFAGCAREQTLEAAEGSREFCMKNHSQLTACKNAKTIIRIFAVAVPLLLL